MFRLNIKWKKPLNKTAQKPNDDECVKCEGKQSYTKNDSLRMIWSILGDSG